MSVKQAIYFGLALFSYFSQAQAIEEVRESFHSVVLDPEESRGFYDLMAATDQSTTTMKAYQAVSEAMLAQVLWNPLGKLSQVTKYDRMMEAVVSEDPKNIEIRFLRLAVEYNLPRFLGMSDHVEVDRQFILSNLGQVSGLSLDPKFGAYIFSFMKEAQLITDHEIEQVKSSLISLHQ